LTAVVTCGVACGVAGSMRAAGSGEPEIAVQVSTVRRSVWDGVYTEAQAKRGKEAYDYSCATCHGPDLEGDPGRDVPTLYGEDFVGEWTKHTVKDLFDLARKAMPKDSPGSLRAETYVDIVSFLLQANEFPSGEQELPADTAALDRVAIEKTPPARK
jgi:quinoprotein glucose dehydrogenase